MERPAVATAGDLLYTYGAFLVIFGMPVNNNANSPGGIYELNIDRGKNNSNRAFSSGRVDRRVRSIWGGGFHAP